MANGSVHVVNMLTISNVICFIKNMAYAAHFNKVRKIFMKLLNLKFMLERFSIKSSKGLLL